MVELSLWNQKYIEKRQLFLRSYQFNRKRSVVERIKLSLIRARRVVWVKLCSARKLQRLVWWRLRFACGGRLRRFPHYHRSNSFSLLNNHHNKSSFPYSSSSSSSSTTCPWPRSFW